METNPSSSRTDKKTIERNRRNRMKALYSKLNSLVPHQTSKETVSLPDQLNAAANYIKKLQTNLVRMKERKDSLMGVEMMPNTSRSSVSGTKMGLRSSSSSSSSSSSKVVPQIEIHEMGSTLEVVLITRLDTQFMFNETIRVLHEEGAEIVNASFFVVDDTVFHTIHSTVEDSIQSNGAARISERLKKFVQDAS